MRSRYSAYACGDDAYVLATWAPETRPSRLFEPGEARPKWMKLKVLGHSTAADGQSGKVHFRAVARTANGALKMEEHSHFRRDEEGHWLYVSGEVLGT